MHLSDNGEPNVPGADRWGCLRRLAVILISMTVLGFCAASVLTVFALRSGSGQSAIVSWALAEGYDGIVIGLTERLIEESPQEWVHYQRRALSFRRSGRLQESLAVYDAAISAQPDAWWPQSHRCFYGALYGDPEIALEHCDKALDLEPDTLYTAYFRRALTRAILDDIVGATEDLEASLKALEERESKLDRTSNELARRRAQYERWLETLRAGQNPFDEETLSGIRVSFFGPPDRPQ